MAYQQNNQQQQQQENYVIGDKLSAIRNQLNDQFADLTQNIERQLADLQRQIAQEKQLSAKIRQELKESDAQRDAMKDECIKKTGDLNQINGFYSKQADANAFNTLLNNIVQRHSAFEQALAQNKYSFVELPYSHFTKYQCTNYIDQNAAAMNKQWQDEIYKISQFIQNSASQSEFAEIVDELTKRTQELQTLKGIEDGNVPCEAMVDLVEKCVQRHEAQKQGKIEDANVLQDNEQWQGLMNMLKEFILANQKELEERNAFYLKELEGRIGDLSNFKTILGTQIDEEKQDMSKLRKKDKQKIKAKKVNTVMRNTKNLSNETKQRHVEIEANVQKTMDLNKEREQQEMKNLEHNDEAWRKEFDEDTLALIEFLV